MKIKLHCLLAASLALLLPASGHAQTAPTVTCSAEQIVECSSNAPVVQATLLDLEGDALVAFWSVNGLVAQTNLVEAGSSSNGVTLSFTYPFSLGTNEVLIEVTDDGSNVVTCSSVVIVQDTIPPVIHSVSANPNSLWPPNHKMRPVALTVVAEDACGPVTWQITSITSNEPDNGTGDGNTVNDYVIDPPHRALLRSERSGPGSGRVYTLTVEATDVSGNVATSSVDVSVPHDRGHGKPPKVKPPKPSKGKGNASPGNSGKGNGGGSHGKGKGKNK